MATTNTNLPGMEYNSLQARVQRARSRPRLERTADISACGTYRYVLGRQWNVNRLTVMFVMLNPSTADAQRDDATIRRCVHFAKDWGYGALTVTNLYALRATNPKLLWQHSDPIGPENEKALIIMSEKASLVVCAWGNNAPEERAAEVTRLLWLTRDGNYRPNHLFCLGRTKKGQPRHPLRLARNTPLEIMERAT